MSLIQMSYIEFNNLKHEPSGIGYEVTDADDEVYHVWYDFTSKKWEWTPIAEANLPEDPDDVLWREEREYDLRVNGGRDHLEDCHYYMDDHLEDRVI